MTSQPIYLDYAAATPVDPRVVEVMRPYFSEKFYNPSAAYLAARAIKRDIAEARTAIAAHLGAHTSEIIFTAGATESINLAIQGVRAHYPEGGFVTIRTEHRAVLDAAQVQPATMVGVNSDGRVALEDLSEHITDQTVLVSLAYANNELGTIQPLSKIAAHIELVRRERKTRGNMLPLYLHTDASQAAGHLDLHVSRLGVDLMTLNAAKIYGPKQVGLLYARTGVELKTLFTGGGQERMLRSGTENVAGIVGFAVALDLAEKRRNALSSKLQALNAKAREWLGEQMTGVHINTPAKLFSPHILSLSFEKVDGERLLMELDERGIQVATGSACAANLGVQSHVLEAIGLSSELIRGSLRLSFGHQTREEQLIWVLGNIKQLVERQREKHYA